MSQTIQVKRGLKADLPILASGEFGFCTDTKEIYVGNGAVNNAVGTKSTYTHSQIAPSQTWVINHELGRYPSVNVVDSAGTLVLGDIKYISEDEIQVSFTAAFAGKVYLN